MIKFFSNLLIKNKDDYQSPEVRQAYGVLCGSVGIGLNIILFAGKLLAGLFSHSIAIMADAINNLSDAGSSVITLIGFRLAGQKPDTDHPYGHGRIEYLSGLFVSLAIIIMAFELFRSSLDKVLHPEPIADSPIILLILAGSIVVKIYMFYYNRSIAKKISSTAMEATSIDSLSDTMATTVVLIATLVAHFTGLMIDGYCGIAVSLFICYAGISAVKDTINPLLGQPPSEEFVQQIRDIVHSYPDVIAIHDLIVHDYGPGRLMISLHAEVPASGNVLDLHDTIDNIEHALAAKLKCHAVIHMDPIITDDAMTNDLKQQAVDILHEIDAEMTLHDFRLVKGPTHTNIIFDIVVPFSCKIDDVSLRLKIDQAFKKINACYYTVIDIDRNYIS